MPDPPETLVRAFCAIDLSAGFRRSLVAAVDRVRECDAARPLRWVRSENLHLTLRFLADISPAQIEAVLEGLRVALRRETVFPLQLESLAWFPSPSRPRVLAALLAPSKSLVRLGTAVGAAAEQAGLPADSRPFRPHITAGRVRGTPPKGAAREALLEIVSLPSLDVGMGEAEMAVSEVVLFRSQLEPTGAVYTVLGSVALANE